MAVSIKDWTQDAGMHSTGSHWFCFERRGSCRIWEIKAQGKNRQRRLNVQHVPAQVCAVR
eukprot:240401-Chlamydomonas_euryale.AAC.13